MKLPFLIIVVFGGAVLLSVSGQRELLEKDEMGPLTLEEFEISEFSSYLASYKGDDEIVNATLTARRGYNFDSFFTCKRRLGCSRLMCGFCCGNRRNLETNLEIET